MIEEEIYSLLSPDFVIYPLIAPANTPAPYLIYTVISETKSDSFCGQAETSTVIQLDSYSNSPFAAKAKALKAYQKIFILGPCNYSAGSFYEEETGLYRYQIEFTLIK